MEVFFLLLIAQENSIFISFSDETKSVLLLLPFSLKNFTEIKTAACNLVIIISKITSEKTNLLILFLCPILKKLFTYSVKYYTR